MIQVIKVMLMGLILFFGGIILTSNGMKHINSEYFKGFVNKVTKNQFICIIIGIIISIALNNSSLVAVSALLLVNAELITVRKAFGIIAGSTIALQILSAFEVDVIQYAAILFCTASAVYLVKKAWNKIADKKTILNIMLSYIIIIISLNLLKSGMLGCIESQWINSVLVDLESNIMVNMLLGLVLSGLCWSPYFIAGLMIAFRTINIIDLETSGEIMLGSCLGIIIPVILAGIVLNKEAKKTALYYLLFELLIAVFSIPVLGKYAEEVLRVSTDPSRQVCFLNCFLGIRCIILIVFFTIAAMVINKITSKIRNRRDNT